MISSTQLAAFDRDGFLLASGLMSDAILATAQEDMRKLLAERSELAYGTTLFSPCYTPELCAVAEALGGDPEKSPYFPVKSSFVIISPPAEGEWTWPGPHIDHAIREHNHSVFPRPYRLASMLYLNDIGLNGGGTVVWPGSHKKIEALAKSNPEKYALMADLNDDLDKAGIGEPQQVIAKAGDILFYHYLLAHAGSKNTTLLPRFGMNQKW